MAFLGGVVQRRAAVGLARHGVDRGPACEESLNYVFLTVIRSDWGRRSVGRGGTGRESSGITRDDHAILAAAS